MIIDEKIVSDIAHLCRLEMEESEKSAMATEMTKILNWMEQLSEVDTENVKPLIHMSVEVNVLRLDEPGNMLSHAAGLKNAPKCDSNYFRVPKVIE